jgi:ribosome-binding protein aMBF1 (putative translation factor)
MIFVADIVNTRTRKSKPCSRLFYNDITREFNIKLNEGVQAEDVPLAFEKFVAENKSELGTYWSKRWIDTRITPPGRQNLGSVLRANSLEEYDEFALLKISKAQSSDDDFALRAPAQSSLEKGQKAFDFIVPNNPNIEEHTPLTDEELFLTVGANIAKYRRQEGLTQTELAKAAGIDQAVLSRAESGKSNMTLSMLNTLANCLGVSPSTLLKVPNSSDLPTT